MDTVEMVKQAEREIAEARKVSLRALRGFRRSVKLRDVPSALHWFGTLHTLRAFEFNKAVGTYSRGAVKFHTLKRAHLAMLALLVDVTARAIL